MTLLRDLLWDFGAELIVEQVHMCVCECEWVAAGQRLNFITKCLWFRLIWFCIPTLSVSNTFLANKHILAIHNLVHACTHIPGISGKCNNCQKVTQFGQLYENWRKFLNYANLRSFRYIDLLGQLQNMLIYTRFRPKIILNVRAKFESLPFRMARVGIRVLGAFPWDYAPN